MKISIRISTFSWILINLIGSMANRLIGITDLSFFEILAGSLVATIPALAGLTLLCMIAQTKSSPNIRLIILAIGNTVICAAFVAIAAYYQLQVFSRHMVNLTLLTMPYAIAAPHSS